MQKQNNLQKKMFSFSLIERVILSAGAMLIFSIEQLAIRTCDLWSGDFSLTCIVIN
jgi:hypothetical protein